MILRSAFLIGLAALLPAGAALGQERFARKRSEVEARGREAVRAYSDAKLAGYGILDASKAPYLADPSGKRDSSKAIQTAMEDARDARLVTFLPAGRYRVSNTLTCIQGVVARDHWDYGPADPVVWNESYFFPCSLTGPRAGARAVIALDRNAPGFGDPGSPRPVVHFWARSETRGKTHSVPPEDPQPNISFNQVIADIDLDLGGNPGAIGINHQAAQGSVIEDVNVNATGAFAGLHRAPGSGGSVTGVSVTGGRYGLFLRGPLAPREPVAGLRPGTQPAPVLTGLRLRGQSEAAILYDSRGPLTVVGAWIEGAGIRVESPRGAPWNGPLNMADSVIDSPGKGTAVESSHSVYLNNVFVRKAAAIVKAGAQPAIAGVGSGWTHVDELAVSARLPLPEWLKGKAGAAILVDGRPVNEPLVRMKAVASPPPDLTARHRWSQPMASWQDAVNVKEPPYNARGDGKTDDWDAIQKAIDANPRVFLPKGVYAVSKPVALKAGTQLIGASHVLTVLTPLEGAPAFHDVRRPAAIVETADDAAATTALAFLQLLVPVNNPASYALRWRAGRGSVVRNVAPLASPWHPDAPEAVHPMVRIEGNGGGRWYNLTQWHWWCQGPDFRFVLAEGTDQPLAFYMLNPEHSHSNAMIEFHNARNIDIFGVKGEGNYTSVLLRGVRRLRWFGYGGLGFPLKDWGLVKIEASDDILLAHIAPEIRPYRPGVWGGLGIHKAPEDAYLILDAPRAAPRCTAQVILYKAGWKD